MITVNGARIACTDTGPRHAPAVVFGHGLLFGGWMFGPQIAALRTRYRCVTLDWRGQGESPPSPGGYDMDTLTADALRLIERLGLAPVHWVGLSMGGFVGQRLAARHGEVLRSLTLLGTSACPEEARKAREYRRMARVQRVTGVRPLLPRIRPLLFGPAFLASPAARPVLTAWQRRVVRLDRTGLRQAVDGVADRPGVETELGRISVPTLIATGADDIATPPAEARRIADLVPAAELHLLAGCGHTSTLEQPARITELLEAFLGRLT
ncbi:alpha/beta fold hydrolase [Amycolatopsis thermoflava]|uniref:Pimeloyl-ACP methyl ester carboxylesterase n=1 Tax=Amycolatopsis thermoflava TaxID=84480 RepID=A0A3N2H5N0_9PSEU|nr:alpha/beta fold hydrolase [Amycolatopsis thermoflava]ROS44224.1 pimeloyl-ACP methyl ester carboxylesterase [Amycolatopsis thermoflava]